MIASDFNGVATEQAQAVGHDDHHGEEVRPSGLDHDDHGRAPPAAEPGNPPGADDPAPNARQIPRMPGGPVVIARGVTGHRAGSARGRRDRGSDP